MSFPRDKNIIRYSVFYINNTRCDDVQLFVCIVSSDIHDPVTQFVNMLVCHP